jgi:glucose/mannose transport system substrate-binding protein
MGSIPARLDVDRSQFDTLSQQTIADWQSPTETFVPAYSILAPVAFQDAASSALRDFVNPSSPDYNNIDVVLRRLALQYPSLKP